MKIIFFIVVFLCTSACFCFESSAQVSSDSLLKLSLHGVRENIERNDYRTAMGEIKKVFKLGITLPDEVAYYYGLLLVEQGSPVKGKEALEKYVDLKGEKGEYYYSAKEYIQKAEAAICNKCNNTNIVYENSACFECDGSGKNAVTCKHCGGIGKNYCRSCNGSGITRSGSGFNEKFLSCTKCNATGIAECRHCTGTGESSSLCRICRGEGKKVFRNNCTH
ncbi:hypothetical protein RCC89_11240 [Cytophagaceae bacterium ABcell3]|nr:hypothetical protein RCC89_11240 [Cytophagaceae bacterium ABcell3]